MGTDLTALRKSKVLLGEKNNEVYIQRDYIDSYRIWTDWIDADVDSWPEGLQYFWWKIHNYESAQYYAKKIKKYYSNVSNQELIIFASWLETFDADIIFELSI